MKLLLNVFTHSVLVLMSLFLASPAYACSDCEDRVCVGFVCACIPNIGRCPPKLPEPERFPFCNITNDGGPNGKPSCFNCSSLFSGDAGKADCLARHQGNYVQSGQCVPAECRNSVSPAAAGWSALAGKQKTPQANSPAPQMMNASGARILELSVSDGKAAKATAALRKADGTELRCAYDLTYGPSKSKEHKGLQFNVTRESCSANK